MARCKLRNSLPDPRERLAVNKKRFVPIQGDTVTVLINMYCSREFHIENNERLELRQFLSVFELIREQQLLFLICSLWLAVEYFNGRRTHPCGSPDGKRSMSLRRQTLTRRIVDQLLRHILFFEIPFQYAFRTLSSPILIWIIPQFQHTLQETTLSLYLRKNIAQLLQKNIPTQILICSLTTQNRYTNKKLQATYVSEITFNFPAM